MTQYLNVGGELIDLYADYEYARGDSSDRARDRRKDLRTLGKTARTTNQVYQAVADPAMGRYEKIGAGVGLGVGVAYGYATLPVVLADGPLPFFDIAWAYSTARFTQKSVKTGRYIGKQFD
jgi:hypothetical protein